MKKHLFFAIVFLSQVTHSQQLNLVTTLSDTLQETSGMIFFNNRIITHNDSGNDANLYEIDTITGSVSRLVHIENAINIDWEDITQDDDYIYIGDFGNNTGSRTDLKIYRIAKMDYLSTINDTIFADTISFTYSDQTDFTPAPFATNYDAEAFISYGDSLFLFTKNWNDARTNIYAIPKTPGNYSIEKIDSLDAQGYVSGATYNAVTNTICLTGYTFTSSFLITLDTFSNNGFSFGNMNRYTLALPNGYSYQTEAICFLSGNYLYISSEMGQGGASGLYSLSLNSLVDYQLLENETLLIYPNPVKNKVTIKGEFDRVELYDSIGKMIYTTTNNHFSVRRFPAGSYTLYIYGKTVAIKQVNIE